MPEKTPAEKLQLKSGMTAAILHAPEGVDLGVPEGVTLTDDPMGADFILEFAADQAEAEQRLSALASALSEKTIAWIGYPKGSKAKGLDISRDTLFAFLRTIELTANANLSIDDTWSSLRFRPLKPGE